MSKHKITWYRWGTINGMDWEDEQEITFEFRAGRPEVRTLRNGDPGYPADPEEIEFVSIKPGAGDHGAFSDIADKMLRDEAENWLCSEGYDAAIEIATSDLADARDYAADLHADR